MVKHLRQGQGQTFYLTCWVHTLNDSAVTYILGSWIIYAYSKYIERGVWNKAHIVITRLGFPIFNGGIKYYAEGKGKEILNPKPFEAFTHRNEREGRCSAMTSFAEDILYPSYCASRLWWEFPEFPSTLAHPFFFPPPSPIPSIINKA